MPSVEYLDITDENGKPLGIKKLRSEVHKNGDFHKSVHIWLINNKHELLIQKRAPTKHIAPGLWTASAAGHISSGKKSLEAAQIELEEELGIKLPAEKFEYLFTNKRPEEKTSTRFSREIDDVFLVTFDTAAEIHMQEEEMTAIEWVHFKTLEQRITVASDNFANLGEEYLKLFKILHSRYDRP